MPTETLQVRSSAFDHGDTIPGKFTCEGADVSPPFEVRGVPDDAESLALVLEDPDAPGGTFVHWVAWNLPARGTTFDEDLNVKERDGVEGQNSWRRTGYGGPCPPSGNHRYFLRVFALDTRLDISGSATADTLRRAMEGHVLAEGELMGRYEKVKGGGIDAAHGTGRSKGYR